MKIVINGTDEIENIGTVIERTQQDGTCILDININDAAHTPDELQEMFVSVDSIDVIRTDLNGEEQSATYTTYTQIDKIRRKISDAADVTTVSLAAAETDAETETDTEADAETEVDDGEEVTDNG